MSVRPYSPTTACSDSLNIAMQSMNVAIRLAETAGIPVQHRLEEISRDMHQVCEDLGHLHRQEHREAAARVVEASPGIPVPIANMLLNLHPQERIALDMATRLGKLAPNCDNDRMACESLFRKGVFRFDPDSNFVIDEKYAPWIKRAETPHEILAGLPSHLRELLRVIAARGGKIHVPNDSQYEHSAHELLAHRILVNDGATDKFRIADPFKDIAA